MQLQTVLFPHLVSFLLGLIHVAMMGSIYTTIAVALERAVTVCAPFTQLKVLHVHFEFLRQVGRV